ncbi:hypothetical protein [Flavobacterium sp.]|uniref:hypothetical protein n=1 Tax=Flavobacterium sp. TaxID=239 RepID=UPI0025D05359|nr:hypothetical protein [Flavobacterium sp.]
MKDLFKKIAKPLLIVSLILLFSCEKDLYEEKIKKDYKFKYETLTGTKAQQIFDRVNNKIRIKGSSIAGSYNRVVITGIGTIESDEVLKVIDSLGKENYTFKVLRPTDNYKVFYNLLFQEKDGYSVVKLFEYTMTDEFAEKYKLTQDFKDFKGTVSYLVLYNDTPCPDPDLIIHIGEVPTITTPGGGGNDNNNPPPGGGCLNCGDNLGHGTGGNGIVDLIAAMLFSDTPRDNPASAIHVHSPYPPPGTSKVFMRFFDPIGTPTPEEPETDPCPIKTQIGILSPYDKCTQSFLSGLDNDSRIWLYDNYDQCNTLQNYIYKSDNCNEASILAKEILEDLIWESKHVNSTDLEANPCTNNVYGQMKQTRLMARLLRNFSGEKPIVNLDWDIANLGTCSSTNCLNGRTTYQLGDTFANIALNSNMISSASKIWIAKTMLHELIHAETIRLLISEGDGDLIPNPNDFPSLWNAYVNNMNNPIQIMNTWLIFM